MAFAHLHVHSQYSLLNGVASPGELVSAAASMGQDALALTDTANLYGAVECWKACKGAKLHPVIGAELWVEPRGIGARDQELETAFTLVLLCEDDAGYRNLCALITRAIFDGLHYRPRIDLDLLRQHRDGLLCLSGGETGSIRTGAAGERERVSAVAEIFGADRFFLELVDQGIDAHQARNEVVRAFSRELGLASVVTQDARYVSPDQAVLLDTLNCVAQGISLSGVQRPRPITDRQHLASEAELRDLFPGDGDAIDRAHAIAHRCHFKFRTETFYFPSSVPPDAEAETDRNWEFFVAAFPPPREFELPRPRPAGAGTLAGYFAWYAQAGLEHRLERVAAERHDAYRSRLRAEIEMIAQMGFGAYLLIVAEFINWAKDRGIPVGPGRGSAAGSLVAWSMRITDIDPLRFDLLFERFLNPERVSMPDIDVDFAQDRREEVIAHVREKYGAELVAQIITYAKLQAKAALKDVARACDFAFQESDRLSKLVPARLNITIDEAVAEEPRLAALVQGDPKVGRVVSLARGIEGVTRQTGVHAAGVVIADRPLVQLVPLYRDGPDGGPVVQFDMKSAETVGLIKFDFLGLKTLDQVRDAVAMVERNTSQRVDISAIPWDDAASWNLLSKGDALGVFQVESSGMRELLTRLRPSCLDDLVALVALFRPGPLSSGMVDDFIDRKHGRKAVAYPFPELAPILAPTYGTIVYQEQVMQVAQVLAGYSLGEADLLRRAMGKKNAEEMAKQKTRFVTGATARGHDERKSSDLFDLLAKFAEYGFNKSHSAAYGFVAYQTAWLKANHRAEYMAALLSIDAGDSDKVLLYLGDCRRAGIKVLPPDVNLSMGRFDVPPLDRRCIRFGLHGVKGLGENATLSILAARASGPFRDFDDLLLRMDYRKVNKKVIEALIKSGACDSLGQPRARLCAALEGAMAAAQAEQAIRAAGQVSLFGGGNGAARPAFKLPAVGEWPVSERMRQEREALGFYLTGHPAEAFADDAQRWGVYKTTEIGEAPEGTEILVSGIVAQKRLYKTKSGPLMAFVQLEDLHGGLEVTFFPKPYERSRAVLDSPKPILVRGKVERRDGVAKLLGEGAELMEDARERRSSRIEFWLRAEELTPETVEAIHALVAQDRGSCTAVLVIDDSAASRPFRATVVLPRACAAAATPRLIEGAHALLGRDDCVRLQ